MKRYEHLTQNKRYMIFMLLLRGKSISEIAKIAQMHRATIYRELKRNSGELRYDFNEAHRKCLARRGFRYEKIRRIQGEIEELICQLLGLGWSPEQISGRLRYEHRFCISHETIYRYIKKNKKAGGSLYRLLRNHKRCRKTRGFISRFQVGWNRRNIDTRPEEVEKRETLGHWERDLLMGKQEKVALLTIVERKSRYTRIKKVSDKQSKTIFKATTEFIREERRKVKTITNDNGHEFADHKKLEAKHPIKVYFAYPYASWQRGTNENTNGLLREYFPRKHSLRDLKKERIRQVEEIINARPRKILNYKTPQEVYFGTEQKLIKTYK
jgi:IS30 family transposase